MSSPYNYTNRNNDKNNEGGTNGDGNHSSSYPPRRPTNIPPSVWGSPPGPPQTTTPPAGPPPNASSLQQAAGGPGYPMAPRMSYYAPNPYATYGGPPPPHGMHRPGPSGMWQPSPPTSGMNVNPYATAGTGRMPSGVTYYPTTASAAPSQTPAAPPPAPPKKRVLVITDKDGNVLDLSKEAGATKQSSLQAAAAATGTAKPGATTTSDAAAPAPASSDAGAKLRQAVLERLAADEKKKHTEEEAKAEEERKARQLTQEEEDKKRKEAELAEKTRKEQEKKQEEERVRKEKEAAAQQAASEATARPRPASLSSLAARLDKQEECKEEGKSTNASTEPRPRSSLSSLAARLEKQDAKEEEGPASPDPPAPRTGVTFRSGPSPGETTKASTSTRKVYSKEQLLRLKALDLCCVRPDDLPDLTIQLISVGGGGQRRGGQRGGGGGGGGGVGGGGGGGGGDWSRGAAPPRQNSDRRGSMTQQESQQWSRGQAPPKPQPQGRGGRRQDGRGGGPPPLYDGPVAPLVRSDKGWRPKKDTSTFAIAEKMVKSILNKMTLEKFDRLATQMCEVPIVSYDILKLMIHNVYEKAIYEPTFGEMYAELCVRLSQSASANSFIQIIESDEASPDGKDNGGAAVYRWSNDVNTSDAEIVGPYASPDECIEAALEDEDEPVERGDMELQLDSLAIREGKFIKVLKKAEASYEDSGRIYYTVFFPVDQHEECGQQLSDIFLTEKECRTDAAKRNSFKRSLLNKCEDEFMKQDIYVDWKKEKAEYEAAKATLTESEQLEKEEELEFRRLKIKTQMLGNIKFIGQLYKKSLLKEKIMRSCVASLLKLKSDDEGSKYPEYVDTGDMDLDEEDHEAVQSLFTTIGKTIDLPHASNFMKVCFTKITKMSDDKALPARSRFMYKDLIELRENSWQPRRKQEKAKTLDEIRKDVEREERRQAQQAAQANYRGGKGDRRDSHSTRNRGGDYRGGDSRRSGQGFDSRGSMTRQRSIQKPATDDEGFTEVTVRRSGSKPQISGAHDGRGDKAIQILKKPTADEARPQEEPMLEPEPEPESEPQESIAPKAFSRDKLERRVDTIRNEYMQDPDNEDELLLSFDELAGTPDAGKTLVTRNADRIMDCKDSERDCIITMISLLFERSKLTSEDIQNGMAEVVEFVDSFVIDSPKAYDYLADMLGELLHVQAIDMDWFAEQSEKAKPDPSSDAAERIISKTMASVKSEYGEDEVRALFGEQQEKLAAVLGTGKWEGLAKEYGLA